MYVFSSGAAMGGGGDRILLFLYISMQDAKYVPK